MLPHRLSLTEGARTTALVVQQEFIF